MKKIINNNDVQMSLFNRLPDVDNFCSIAIEEFTNDPTKVNSSSNSSFQENSSSSSSFQENSSNKQDFFIGKDDIITKNYITSEYVTVEDEEFEFDD